MRLVYPNKKYLKSYNEARQEYIKNNVTTYMFDDISEIDVVQEAKNYRNGINLKSGYVPQTTYWLVDGDEFIGEVSIRHKLNENLLKYGGHIGYGVRCSKWNMGYGTKMLSLALKKARKMGLDKVLITCDEDNIGSAKVMENNGGKLENIIENIVDGKKIHTKRYWINIKEKK